MHRRNSVLAAILCAITVGMTSVARAQTPAPESSPLQVPSQKPSTAVPMWGSTPRPGAGASPDAQAVTATGCLVRRTATGAAGSSDGGDGSAAGFTLTSASLGTGNGTVGAEQASAGTTSRPAGGQRIDGELMLIPHPQLNLDWVLNRRLEVTGTITRAGRSTNLTSIGDVPTVRVNGFRVLSSTCQ